MFDHLKTTSAIAACLYQYHEQKGEITEKDISNEKIEKFLLVSADLSGIQNYIFDISSIGSGAVAKKLRARSFKISMLMEAAALMVLNELELPYSSILYCSGGRFHILAPNTGLVKQKLDGIKVLIDKWLLLNYAGMLSINFATVEFSAVTEQDVSPSFKNFAGVLAQASNKLFESKLKKFSSVLTNENDHVLSDIFEVEFGDICRSCKKMPGTVKEAAEDEAEESQGAYSCQNCADDKKIGEILPKARFVSFGLSNANANQNENNRYGEKTIKFFDKIALTISDKSITDDAFIVYDFSSRAGEVNTITELANQKPVVTKFIANYVPLANNKVITFNELANKSDGAQYLGILKADVDRLGLIFSRGLGEYSTISRLSTLSRMLDLFFTGYLPKLIKEDYEHVYIVFSGGDDLLLVGPWDKLFDLSNKLYTRFRAYTAYNPDITLSAGLTLATKKSPIWHMAEMAEEELEMSKSKGRDRLTIFSTTFEWSKYNNLRQFAEIFNNAIEEKAISPSFVYSLLQFCNREGLGGLQDKSNENVKESVLRKARLTYQIARHLGPKRDEQESKIRQETRNLLASLISSEGAEWWNYMAVPISHSLLRLREGSTENAK